MIFSKIYNKTNSFKLNLIVTSVEIYTDDYYGTQVMLGTDKGSLNISPVFGADFLSEEFNVSTKDKISSDLKKELKIIERHIKDSGSCPITLNLESNIIKKYNSSITYSLKHSKIEEHKS